MTYRVETADLPAWLSPMQAVVWIAIRDGRFVLRASPHDDESRKATAALSKYRHRIGSDPGMTFLKIDLVRSKPNAGEEAVSDLISALRSGKVIAHACPYSPGRGIYKRRKAMAPAEWTSMDLNTIGEADQRLCPCRRAPTGTSAVSPAKEWDGVMFETSVLLTLWPPRDSHRSALLSADLRDPVATVVESAAPGQLPLGGTDAVTKLDTFKRARKKTGPKPVLREDIARRMVVDFQGEDRSLEEEKIEALLSRYGSSPNTVDRARDQALKLLRADSEKH